MHELARVTLDNDMDLILVHKRCMKLGELGGLSLSAQTTFATAVSEISRNALESEKGGCLILNVETDGRDKYLVACLKDKQFNHKRFSQGLEYAKRLVNKYNVSEINGETNIELFYNISPPFRIDVAKVEEWRNLFRTEVPISPYEELKRKNEQLLNLSEKVQTSEAQYRALTNSLPMIIFSLDMKGHLLYANEWLTKYTGETIDSLNGSGWKAVVHENDYESFYHLLKNPVTKGSTTIKTQARLKHKNGEEFLWHQISISPFINDTEEEIQYWIGYIVDIHTQKVFEETLKDNAELKRTQDQLKENQQTLEKYIEELNRTNYELQQFAFVASHDLQEPVRKLLFYSDYLLKTYTNSIDQKGFEYLGSMHTASKRMRTLIQDLLTFSRINKEEIRFKPIDLNTVAKEALQDLEISIEEKGARINIQSLPVIISDQGMMRQLFGNIIHNSIKYSKPANAPVIEITCQQKDNFLELSFSDNGIGFNEQYLPQMFTLFQRLHDRQSYEGTGLGLAICRKIAEIHGGKIWAQAKEGEGATFFVSLPMNQSAN